MNQLQMLCEALNIVYQLIKTYAARTFKEIFKESIPYYSRFYFIQLRMRQFLPLNGFIESFYIKAKTKLELSQLLFKNIKMFICFFNNEKYC